MTNETSNVLNTTKISSNPRGAQHQDRQTDRPTNRP